MGQAVVEISLHDEGDRTRIEMREDASDGLGSCSRTRCGRR